MKWNRHILRKVWLPSNDSISGLTLIESLVAIAIIGITAASIGPVIVISAATRIQSQRAEQALQLAQGEIDRVRQILEQRIVDDGVGGTTEYSTADLMIASTPTTIINTPANALGPTAVAGAFNGADYQTARSVDIDGDTVPDFAVQAFRFGATERSVGGQPIAFEMGVRVYEIDAIDGTGTALSTAAARLGTTAGEAERKEKPLAVLYTEVTKSDERQSLCEYFEFKGSTTATIGTLDCS
ncbi:MAG: prepilin-type N-terminal cleavage/methylation domain-containing protein [Cyanobacteria bacterium P01_A01_bin.15]